MRPIPQSEGHDAPWLVGERVPGVTAMVDEVVVACEHAVGEPVFAHELSDVRFPRFVAKPQFYIVGIDALLAGDRLQLGGDVFLNASIAPSACA
jgi:hypothetical protein